MIQTREKFLLSLALVLFYERREKFLRTIIGVPIALVCYIIFVALIFGFCNWSFEKPADWSYGIPIITSLFSLGGACAIAEKFSSTAGAKITAMIIATFWILLVIVDIGGSINDVITVLTGGNLEPDLVGDIISLLDGLLNAKIFAVVSCILALGQK